jgi:hypothetical protein
MIIDYIIYIIGILLVIPQYNMLLKMITLDSIYCAFDFFKLYININITESQIITQSSTLFDRPLIDRYILYILKYITYIIFCLFIWVDNFYPLYIVLLLSTIPPITNKILSSDAYNKVISIKETIIKIILAKNLSHIIKYIAKNMLDRDINVKHKELLPIFNDYTNTVSYVTNIFKNTFIVLLMSYLKKNYTNTYYRMTKYLYSYKTGDTLRSFNSDSAKNIILHVIENKQWTQLLKPNIYAAVLQLYQINNINNNNNNNIHKYIIRFNFILLKIFSGWTIASIFNSIFVPPLYACLLFFYRNDIDHTNLNKFYKIISIILSTGIGYLLNDLVIATILCQISYEILSNNIVLKLLHFFYKKFRKFCRFIYNAHGKYIPVYITTFIYLCIIGQVLNIYTILLVSTQIIHNSYTNNDRIKVLIFNSLFLSTLLSLFHPLHIIFNCVLIYLYFSLYYKYTHAITLNTLYTSYNIIKKCITQLNLKISEFALFNTFKQKPMINDNVFTLNNNKFIDEITINNNPDNPPDHPNNPSNPDINKDTSNVCIINNYI